MASEVGKGGLHQDLLHPGVLLLDGVVEGGHGAVCSSVGLCPQYAPEEIIFLIQVE